MGYDTKFKGELKFKTALTEDQLNKVESFLYQSCKDHPEWGRTDLSFINLELLEDNSGLKWSEDENSYDMIDKVNLIIENMQKEYPEFGLTGKMLAQGEDVEDRWILEIVDGKAVRKNVSIEI